MFAEERIGEILRQLLEWAYPDYEVSSGWRMQHTVFEKRMQGDPNGVWEPVDGHSVWGGDCEYLVFENEVTIPEHFEGKTVEFVLRTGREGQWDATNPQFTVFTDGILRQGFDVNHETIRLCESAEAGEKHRIFLSAYTGVSNFHLLFQAELRTVDETVLKLYYDLLVPWQTACTLDPDSYDCIRILEHLTTAVNLLDLRRPGSEAFYAAVEKAQAYLNKVFYQEGNASEAQVLCVGHTHIDVAWLWTLSVTEDKAVRSFSTVLELMRRYPEYTFMSSQPQLYLYVKQNAPEIYEQIRERVKEGRWEVEGGMFVEADCNLAGGEALVRQILYGKTFFAEEFGKDNRILWLPDVFGYCAALPQILKKSRMDYFMTTKISWNEVNKLPYDTFYWEGIDGSRVLTHFITTRDYVSKTRNLKTNTEFTTGYTTNYNGEIHPSQIRGAWQRYQQKALSREVLCSYGYGDGGGGPTEEMLEIQRRLAYGIPGCPKTKPGTALDFFERLEENLEGKKVPVWSGELYLEYHRATYTSMARNKKYNRRSEFALTDLEWLGVLAGKICGADYPGQLLSENWQVLMRNQFHDILPGSSIFAVYEDSKREYEKLFSEVIPASQALSRRITQQIGGTLVFNPCGMPMSGRVETDADPGLEGVQKTHDGKYLLYAENVPAKGFKRIEAGVQKEGCCRIGERRIETPFAVIDFDEKGRISAWYDVLQERNILKEGVKGNVLIGYEDKPHKYDNWNLFDYYKEKGWEMDELLDREVIEEGPLRYGLRMSWRFMDSVIEEKIFAYPDSPKVDFVFRTDWKESQIFLKTLFPLDLNVREAAYEIQYGNVKRPVICNTSWDQARFEVCYHKWMDLSEGGFGVSFLNDCKYGVSVDDGVVGISLIKCGLYPNPKADREVHEAVYSVYPHEGSWQEAGTVREAYLLNDPLFLQTETSAETAEGKNSFSMVCTDQRNLMIEVVKKAEKGAGTVVRLYEFENRRTRARVRFGAKYHRIWRVNLLEEKEVLLGKDTDEVEILAKPFEILTLLAEENKNETETIGGQDGK